MSRVWFAQPLETAATFWRVERRDGVTLGFTSHDRDVWFDGLLHRAAPGMTPSAIRRSADIEPDSADVRGALSHDALDSVDLASGRFDGAHVRIGLVDWSSAEHETLYRGTIGSVAEEEGAFTAELVSRKADLLRDPVPRTSPSCRAAFCGPGCTLPPPAYTHEAVVAAVDPGLNAVTLTVAAPASSLAGGTLHWLDGPQAGLSAGIVLNGPGGLVLDRALDPSTVPGIRALVREGCDHTLDTCATRFGNAINFQGEPFLPGNDMIYRYPVPRQ